MIVKRLLSTLCLLTIVAGSQHSLAQTPHPIQVARGVQYQQTITTGAHPMVINVLRVNLHDRGVRAFVGQAYGGITSKGTESGRQTVEDMAARYHAVAGVNADFFPWTGRPLDLAIHNGHLYSFPYAGRPAIGFTRNGTAVIDQLDETCTLTKDDGTHIHITGIDEPSALNSAVLYNSYYQLPVVAHNTGVVITLNCGELSPTTHERVRVISAQPMAAGETVAPPLQGRMLLLLAGQPAVEAANIGVGDRCTLTAMLTEHGGSSRRAIWQHVLEAVSGGPWILRNNKVVPPSLQPGFGLHSFILYHHPRTAVGITANGDLILGVVDGRSPLSSGMSLAQLGELMKQAGAVDAMNLDGGGSSVMVVRGRVVNMPSDGTSRLVANSLLISAPTEEQATVHAPLALVNPPHSVTAGSTLHLRSSGDPWLWGTSNGRGFVSQTGNFTSYTAGITTVIAGTGGARTKLGLEVVPAAVSHFRASLVMLNAFTSTLTVHAYDRYGNSVEGVHILVTTQPALPAATIITDAHGLAGANITWPAEQSSSDSVSVSAPGATPLVILRSAQKPAPVRPVQPTDPDNNKTP